MCISCARFSFWSNEWGLLNSEIWDLLTSIMLSCEEGAVRTHLESAMWHLYLGGTMGF